MCNPAFKGSTEAFERGVLMCEWLEKHSTKINQFKLGMLLCAVLAGLVSRTPRRFKMGFLNTDL